MPKVTDSRPQCASKRWRSGLPMNPAKEHELAVFEAALQLPVEQRGAYLEKACGADGDLRRRVDDLLGAADRAGGFMRLSAVPEPGVAFRPPPTEKPGDMIG